MLSIDTAIIPLSDDNSDSAPKTKHSKQPRFEVSSVLLCTDCHCSPASCRTCNHECQHLVSGSSTQTHDKKRRWSFGKDSELSVKIRLLLALEANPHPNPTRREINIMRAPGRPRPDLDITELYDLRQRHKDLPIVFASRRKRGSSWPGGSLLSQRAA